MSTSTRPHSEASAPTASASAASAAPVVTITRKIAAVIIGISALARTLMSFQGYYLLDDYAFVGRAGRPDALTLSTLLEPHLGHLMPAAHVLVWVQQSVAPWNYALPAITMALGWLGCLLLMYRILTSWIGTRPVILIPLAAYALTPLTIQATTWWAAALNAIPLQLCALGGVLVLLPLAKGASRLSIWRQLALVALTIVALGFFTKGVLLLVLFAGVSLAWAPGSLVAAAVRAFRAGPVMWVALFAITVSYSVAYSAIAPTPASPSGIPGILSVLDRIAQSVIGGVLPSVAGGPGEFTPGADPLSSPPLWVIGLGVAFLVALIAGVARSTRTTRRLAAVCLVYAIGCMGLIAVRQQGFTLLMAGTLRYFADLAIPATLLVASLSRDALGLTPRSRTAGRWIAAAILLVAFGAMSLLTTAQLIANPYATAIGNTAMNAQESMGEQTESPILDTWVPPLLLTPLFYGDYARSSVMFAQVPAGVAFAEQGRALRLWSPDGRLVPARIEGPLATGLSPSQGGTCDVRPGSPTTLQLSATVVPYTHAVELSTVATRPTSAQVSIGGAPPRRWMLPEGRATMYAWMFAGETADITVVPDDPDAVVCVTSVRVGAPVPLEDAR